MLKDELDRMYFNYDRCLKAFEDIIVKCASQKNYAIANIVENCVKDLKRPNRY